MQRQMEIECIKSFFIMTNHIKIVLIVLISIMGLTACEKAHNTDTSTLQNRPIKRVLNIDDFPKTDPTALTQLMNKDEDILCPVIARMVASYEMLEGGYHLLNQLRSDEMYYTGDNEYMLNHEYETVEWKLTDYPRVIFDDDDRVKYYEFGLVEGNKVTSTITVYARREAPHAIAFIFPYVLPYTYTKYNYYVGNYPHRVIFDGSVYRPVENHDGEEVFYKKEDPREYWRQIEIQASEEDLAELKNLQNRRAIPDLEMEKEATKFWNDVDNAVSASVKSLDQDDPCLLEYKPEPRVENTYIKHLKDVLGTSDYCRDYTARSYCSTPLQQTYWSGACGPAALAWIYRGLRKTYPIENGEYLPIHGDQSGILNFYNGYNSSYYYYNLQSLESLCWAKFSTVKQAYIDRSIDVDNGLTGVFYKKSIPIKWNGSWEFALFPWDLDGLLKDVTNGYFGVTCDKTALYAADWIHERNLPVMLLMSSLDHYLVAYGYGGVSKTKGGDISRKDLYFLVTDNGYTIKEHYYKPYWRRYQKYEYYHCIYLNQ